MGFSILISFSWFLDDMDNETKTITNQNAVRPPTTETLHRHSGASKQNIKHSIKNKISLDVNNMYNLFFYCSINVKLSQEELDN